MEETEARFNRLSRVFREKRESVARWIRPSPDLRDDCSRRNSREQRKTMCSKFTRGAAIPLDTAAQPSILLRFHFRQPRGNRVDEEVSVAGRQPRWRLIDTRWWSVTCVFMHADRRGKQDPIILLCKLCKYANRMVQLNEVVRTNDIFNNYGEIHGFVSRSIA